MKSLFQAVCRGDLDSLKSIVGDSPNEIHVSKPTADRNGDTLLHVICRYGRKEMLTFLEEIHGTINYQQVNLEGKTPLHEAAQFGQVTLAQHLLDRGVPVDSLKRADWTPLMLACTKSENRQMVSVLLDAGADSNLRNKDGWTAFHLAAREGDTFVLHLLLKHNPVAWKTVSKNGRTPLHSVSLKGDQECLRWLLQNCPFPKA